MQKFVYGTLVFLLVMAPALRYLAAPWIWICLTGAGILFVITYFDKNRAIKFISLNVGVIMLTFGLFEAYLWRGEITPSPPPPIPNGIQWAGGTLYPASNNLSLRPGVSVTATKYIQGNIVYQVRYTTNAHGLRHSPAAKTAEATCILFFGGSFTFGEGVNDAETLPYRVAVKTDRAYQVYNFGMPGFGPQQMLRAIEQGFVAEVIGDCEPHYIFYHTIPNHAARAAGIPAFTQGSPKYVLDETNQPVYAGTYPTDDDAHLPYPLRRIKWQLEKSRTYQNLFAGERSMTARDLDLYLAIVQQSQRLLTTQYPTAEFHIIMWHSNPDEPFVQGLSHTFASGAVKVHPITDILVPQAGQTWGESFHLSVYDDHPNPTAYDGIATYIVNNIIAP